MLTIRQIQSLILPVVLLGMILIITPCSAGFHLTASTNMTLAKGDTLTITGTGYTNGSVSLWGIGHSSFMYRVIPAAPDGTINETIAREVTATFRSGPFMVIIQDPGRDRTYSFRAIVSEGDCQLVSGEGTKISDFEPDALNIPAALDLADRLRDRIGSGGGDDSGTLQTIYVEEPSLEIRRETPDTILKVSDGENLPLEGTMNMAADDRIIVKIFDTAVIGKTGSRVPVMTGTALSFSIGGLRNHWEYILNSSCLSPGEYLVESGWERSVVSGRDAIIIQITNNGNKYAGSLQPSGVEKMYAGLSYPRFFWISRTGGSPLQDPYVRGKGKTGSSSEC